MQSEKEEELSECGGWREREGGGGEPSGLTQAMGYGVEERRGEECRRLLLVRE